MMTLSETIIHGMDSSSPTDDVKPLQTVQGPGSLCNIKKLWDGGLDSRYYQIWLNEIPDDGEDLNSCEETLRYAITIRHMKTKTKNVQSLHDIIIRSKYMRKLLETAAPGMSDLYDENQKGLVLSSPFKPLFFAWTAIEKALMEENQGSIFNMHASLLHTTLKEVYDEQFLSYLQMIEKGQVTFAYIWALLPVGADVWTKCEDNDLIARLTATTLQQDNMGKQWWTVTYDYIIWNGKSFGWTASEVNISSFEGRVDIKDLPIHPLPYHEAAEHVGAELSRRGRSYGRRAIKEPLIQQYSGEYTLNNDTSSSWWAPRRKVKVAERVMFDTLAYNQYGGSTAPVLKVLLDAKGMTAALDDPDCGSKDAEIFRYCAPLLYAFGLKSKEWLQFDIHACTDVVWNTEAWSQLVLEHDTKALTRAFAQTQLSGGGDGFDDFIAGKSQGMIMLLAGPPGTGKTFTAESLGDELRQPLYSVGANELGSSAHQVETSLGRAFDLAARWNALVLLDEADVFLRRRSDSQLERNGVIAVFLRKLEYFKGLIFLTTNRAQDFDEAFESRIHITIQYPDLTRDGRKQVWTKMIAKADDTAEHGAEVDEEDIAELSDISLNGREIRNIIKSAMLLSVDEADKLSKKHIDTVLKVKYGKKLSSR